MLKDYPPDPFSEELNPLPYEALEIQSENWREQLVTTQKKLLVVNQAYDLVSEKNEELEAEIRGLRSDLEQTRKQLTQK
jgi:septal ring factor EnvC (AmiA/AmiB activator)